MNGLSLQQTEELFQLVRPLKKSRRGSVSLVRHRNTGEEFFLRRFNGDGSAYRRLQNVSSPHLPAIHHVCEENGEVLVVEEYIRGRSLDDLLRRRTFSLRETRKLMLQLCSALSLLHRQDIVHRDIKPDNVILRDSGAVLVDFDAARLFEPGSAADTQVLGTVGFAAPEQFGISQSDTRADIYALGVMLNIMLTGSHPSMGRLAPGPMGKIVRRCTMANPGDRYQTVEQLMRALRVQPLKPWLIGAAAVVLAGALAFTTVRLALPAPDRPAAQSTAPTVSPSVPAAAPTPEETPRPLLIPLDVSHTTVSRLFSDESVKAEFTLVEVQPTVEALVRVTAHLSVDRPFTLNAWTASGSWTLSPIPLTAGEHSAVFHIPEDTLTADEQFLLFLTAEDSPEENRLVVRLSGADILARLHPTPTPIPSYTPAPTGEKEQITFIDPARKVLYVNRNLPFDPFYSMGLREGYGVKFIHAQAQPLEGDMARVTVFFSVEKDMELSVRTGTGRWALPSATVTPEHNGLSFDISRSTLESDTLLQITLSSPFEDIKSARVECHMTIMTASIINLLTVPDHSTPKPSSAPTPVPSYTVPQSGSHPAWDPSLAAAGPVVELAPDIEYGANGYEAYGMEIHGLDARLMEGNVVRFTLHFLVEMDFRFFTNITIASGIVWSSGEAYGYQGMMIRAGDTELSIDIPLSELVGRTTLWMELNTRVPSLDGSNPSIENRARIYLGIKTVLETLAAATPNLPASALAPRTAITEALALPCYTEYTGSDGLPSTGFTFYELTAQVFSDNTVTFTVTFRAEGVFHLSLFEPPDNIQYGINTFGPGDSGWTMTVPLSRLSYENGISYKFYEEGSYANCGFLHVTGGTLRSVLG